MTRRYSLPIDWASRIGIGVILSLALRAPSQVASPPASVPPPPKWERSASFGFTLTSGNSHTVLFTADAQAQKKWPEDELSFGANAGYGKSEGVKNSDYLKGFGQYNRLFTERFYGYARLDAMHDDIADVDYRLTLSPGAGYYFIKRQQTRLSAEAGPAFVYERQGGETHGYMTLRLAERFEHRSKTAPASGNPRRSFLRSMTSTIPWSTPNSGWRRPLPRRSVCGWSFRTLTITSPRPGG